MLWVVAGKVPFKAQYLSEYSDYPGLCPKQIPDKITDFLDSPNQHFFRDLRIAVGKQYGFARVYGDPCFVTLSDIQPAENIRIVHVGVLAEANALLIG